MKQTEVTIFSSTFKAAQPLACALFESALSRGKVANAYLLTGRAAEHKQILAQQLACYLNCEKVKEGAGTSCVARKGPGPDGAPATDSTDWCLNCQWIGQNSHPQAWLSLEGEGKSNKIPVDRARALTDELSMTSKYSRVIVVPQSDEVTFHRPAANALLKSIEEPPPNCVFLFFADTAEDVLATIVSRCQVVPLAKPLQLGHWMQAADARKQLAPEVTGRLEAARSAFILNARRYVNKSGVVSMPAEKGSRPVSDTIKISADSSELTKQLLDLFKELFEIMDEQQAVEQILDLVVASEIEVHREDACTSPQRCRYLMSVVEAAEKAKRQVNSYVKPANVIESFCFTLNDLRYEYSGEPSLAKR